jgi:hypothetical protein
VRARGGGADDAPLVERAAAAAAYVFPVRGREREREGERVGVLRKSSSLCSFCFQPPCDTPPPHPVPAL